MNDELAIKLHRLDYVLTDKEIEKLRELCSVVSCSWCPLIDFFNDIQLNKSKTYDKNQAYKDLWLIVLIVVDRQEEHRALEVIKKKGVNLYKLKMCDSVEEYNKLCNTALQLTEEEFDLLRRVLL